MLREILGRIEKHLGREATGRVLDRLTDPKTEFFHGSWFDGANAGCIYAHILTAAAGLGIKGSLSNPNVYVVSDVSKQFGEKYGSKVRARWVALWNSPLTGRLFERWVVWQARKLKGEHDHRQAQAAILATLDRIEAGANLAQKPTSLGETAEASKVKVSTKVA